MNKTGLIRDVAAVLKRNDVRKAMPAKKHVFYISDDEGNSKKFSVTQQARGVLFGAEDVEAVIDAMLFVINEAIKRGEQINLQGFGSFKLRHLKHISVKDFNSDNKFEVPDRYTVKFVPGCDMKNSAAVYGTSIEDMRAITLPLGLADEDEDDEDGEE
jgi:DNA-binding protein HU-beta